LTTPPARLSRHGRLAAFERVEGEGGLAALLKNPQSALSLMMMETAKLHQLKLTIDLAPYQPLRLIVPRLKPQHEAVFGRYIADALAAIDRLAPRNVTLHGDLHAGQFIIDGSRNAWLLDFDDLAQGPAEADIGNFAAHLATSPAFGERPPLEGMRSWLHDASKAYPAHGEALSADLADAYGRIALLRRALKLAERGQTGVCDQLAREIMV
jgi:Ser/Thr protein kinase RdoA (MazF antagonist)